MKKIVKIIAITAMMVISLQTPGEVIADVNESADADAYLEMEMEEGTTDELLDDYAASPEDLLEAQQSDSSFNTIKEVAYNAYPGVNDIRVYSKARDGEKWLSKNFQVKEFSCNDGSDEIYIDMKLVSILQNIRDHFGKPVTITSAYRTVTHNARVGGASRSFHLKGMAADIMIEGISTSRVAVYAESIGVLGIGMYSDFNHIDTRTYQSYWNQLDGSEKTVSGFVSVEGITVSNVTKDGYTVTIDIGGKQSNLTGIKLATWTAKNGQDDIKWTPGYYYNGKSVCRINISDHNYEEGSYYTHVYLYDNRNLYAAFGGVGTRVDYTAPVVTEPVISNISPIGYKVSANITDNNAVSEVILQSCAEDGSQFTTNGIRSGNNYIFDVMVDDAGSYLNTIIAKDQHGNINNFVTFETKVPIVDSEMLIPGDVDFDGTLTSNDALTVLKHCVRLVRLNQLQQAVADINGNTVIDATDAFMILKATVGLL